MYLCLFKVSKIIMKKKIPNIIPLILIVLPALLAQDKNDD